jgi:Fe-S-cluster containining protein
MASDLRSRASEVYRDLLPPFFDVPVWDESLATCDSCAMSKTPLPYEVRTKVFKPHLKCCTYFPRLPNHLVGAILSDTSPEGAEGRKRVLEIIRSRVGVTPFEVAPPDKWTFLFTSHSATAFGNVESWLCPYYERSKGNCTIWKYRNPVCRTYFCISTGGDDGIQFWNKAQRFLAYFELSLSKLCVSELAPDLLGTRRQTTHEDKIELTVEELDDLPPNPETYAKAWGKWQGKEVEFYEKCYQIVQKTDSKAVTSELGSFGASLLDTLEAGYAPARKRALPAYLQFNPQITVGDPGNTGVVGLTVPGFEAVNFPVLYHDILTRFDGAVPVKNMVEKIEQEFKVTLSESQLTRMVVMRILLPLDMPPGSPTDTQL